MDQYCVGQHRRASFVNLDVRTFGGKSPEARTAVSEAALTVLADAFEATLRRKTACDISVQITELDRPKLARTRSADHSDRPAA